ncbi:hypothetical protein INT43_006463 [Umbelopsis isabellina]|uniref:Uncharacterized protein n=1 Tax=Mortierella isabellina TaxID=91625 RepID=A0A8H7UIY5_MORIS|nr:hypothetical protein INT43_006463 [Umbelopsis isabellina]
MSSHDINGGDVEDAPAYERRYTNDPVEKIESQSFNDEKGDPYINELGNPDVDHVDITSDGEEKEIGTEERGGIFGYLDLISETIPELDDPNLHLFTFRTVFLGLGLGCFAAVLQEIYYFKPQVIVISPLFIQIIGYVLGTGMARVIPTSRFFNPAPFNIKEHVLISITGTSAATAALATELLAVMDLFYNKKVQVGVAIFTVLSSQLLGYGFAGCFRSFLVYPRHTYFPTVFPSITLYDSLHNGNVLTSKRLKVFWGVFVGIFIWEWFPEYIFPWLNAVSFFCLGKQDSQVFTNIFGGSSNNEGLGMLSFCFDWNYIGLVFSPMYLPLTTQLNMVLGYLGCYIMFTWVYYTNKWNAQAFPFLSQELYLLTEGSSYWNYTIYDQTAILDENYVVVPELLQEYGLPWYSTTYVMYLTVANVSLTAAVTHIGLYHGKAIWNTFKSLWHGKNHQGKGDVHFEMMQKYKEVPLWWYLALLLVSFGVAMGMIYAGESTMPWWGLILAVILAFIVTGVNCLMTSTTGFTISTEAMIQLIGGYVMPGKPVANMWFTLYGYNTIGQATSMIVDLKIGHYMKIPPRALFSAQIAGTIIGGLLNYIMMLSIVENQREILLSPQGTNIWSGQNVQQFNSGAVTWGGLAHELFSPGKIYYPVAWSFLVGFLVPVPFYLLHRRFPKVGFNTINTAIVVWFFGDLCVGINSSITMALCLGMFFQFYMRKYRSRWFAKYQFIVSAALDSGTLFSIFVMTFAVFGAAGTTYPFPEWWGNPMADNQYPDHCYFDPRLAG